jgi:CubicO group peptidase (beta-lactamase class C family)
VLRGKPAGPVGKAIYSNGGYTIAGAIAERIAGESWESLVRARVFTPLGLHGSFAWSDSADVNQPWGHHETRAAQNLSIHAIPMNDFRQSLDLLVPLSSRSKTTRASFRCICAGSEVAIRLC